MNFLLAALTTVGHAFNFPTALMQMSGGTATSQTSISASGTFTVPSGVYSISVIAVGRGGTGGNNGIAIGCSPGTQARGGGGGGGGALAYANNIAVTPGQAFTVTINGTSSKFGTNVEAGAGGNGGSGQCNVSSAAGTAGTVITGTGGAGAAGSAAPTSSNYGEGGGAGGYSAAGNSGSGGSAATGTTQGGGGGGVDVLGSGASATAGTGNGGSGGANGLQSGVCGSEFCDGGAYGGGGGGSGSNNFDPTTGGTGGAGVVRVIWPGSSRSFPSTNTGNL